MKIIKYLIIVFYSCFIMISCFKKEKQKNVELSIDEGKYKLKEIESYNFRRSYHYSHTLQGRELNLFMERNPEPSIGYKIKKTQNKYKILLSEIGIFQDGNLNIKKIDSLTLPEEFNYQVSQNNFYKVKTRSLGGPLVELTFTKNKKVLTDTLLFGFPPDVRFIKIDLDKDGKEELMSIYRKYIINGDNFDLSIYQLKK